MSGSTIGGVVGAAVGFWVGGPTGAKWGWMIGSAVGGAVDPDVIKAPSIGDAQRQTSQAGIPIPKIYGKPQRFKGNVIDGETIARKITVQEEQGKGGPVVESERFLLTYAIGVCEGPIAGFQRILRNGEVVFDRSVDDEYPAYDPSFRGLFINAMRAKTAKWSGSIRMYLGTEDQLPDPALESIWGVGNTPYFRGLAYVVIIDDDVTQGKGAANIWEFEPVQVGVEGESESAFSLFAAISPQPGLGSKLQRSASGTDWDDEALQAAPIASRMIWGDALLLSYGSSQLFYSANRGATGSWTTSAASIGGSGGTRNGCFDLGTFYIPGGIDGTYTTADGVTTDHDSTYSNAIAAENGIAVSITYLNTFSSKSINGGASWTAGGNLPGGVSAVEMCVEISEGLTVAGYKNATTGLAQLAYSDDYGINWHAITSPFSTGTTVSAIRYGLDASGTPVWWAATDTGEFAYSGAGSSAWILDPFNMGEAVKSIAYSSRRFVAGGENGTMGSATTFPGWAAVVNNFDSDDTIESVVAMGCPGTEMPDSPGYYVDEDGQICGPAIITLQATDVILRDVVEDIASRANLPPERLDASELLDIIPGYLLASGGSVADAIRPLQQPFVFDTPEIDQQIVCVKRGGATAFALTDDDLLEMTDQDARITPQPVEYPKKVHFVVPDPDANYTATPQTAERYTPDVKAIGEMSVQVPIPFRADPAKQIVEIMLKVAWARAEGTIELPLPEKYSQYVPSDCFTYANRRWMIEESTYADGEIKVRAVYDRITNYSANGVGVPATTPNLPGDGVRGPTVFEWMNLPILRDSDDRIGFYVAVTGILTGWDGCTIQARVQSASPWTTMATITTRTVMGKLVTALPIASGDVIDETNTVRVQVYGELSSITEEQLLNEGNPCLIGDELCQFQTASFVAADGTLNIYDLSILTRGRLDSTPSEHAIGDRFVMLSSPNFIEAPSSWIGQTISIRAVTNTTDGDNNETFAKNWSPALIQTEWAPVQFIGDRDASNNVSISWNGRGRLGTNGNPFHSTYFDGYRVAITKGVTTVTKSNTSLQSYSYTSAEQTADFGSDTGALTINVYAMNRITGASAALTGTVP